MAKRKKDDFLSSKKAACIAALLTGIGTLLMGLAAIAEAVLPYIVAVP